MRKSLGLAMVLLCALAVATVARAQTQANLTQILNGTITTGGTFQTGQAATFGRKSIDFENKSGNGDKCYLYFGSGSPTTSNSLTVPDGSGYLRSSGTIPSDQIQLTCTNTGDVFYLAVQ